MVAYDIKCKFPYNYDNSTLDEAFDVIQLQESHEVGEIINNYWLIVNCDLPFSTEPEYKFDKGEFVKVIDIRFFDIFATDKNYDDRKDLIKYNTEVRRYYNQDVKVNRYGYR